jgi:L-ascorbate metabolism protein UlaG (beta-lactamase superfamily)
MIKAWVMLVCISHADHVCHTAALADNETFASKTQCEKRIMERFVQSDGLPKHCEEITITETAKYPSAGTPCVILGHPTAGGIYDDAGNCIVPFRFTRPDGIVEVKP